MLIALGLCLTFALPAGAQGNIVYQYASKGEKARICLTFDDGPHPRYTPIILDILAEYGVPATFFSVGVNAETYPELMKRIVREGHEVANHTYNHCHVAKLNTADLKKDMLMCSDTIERVTGKRPVLFRPPEGVCSRDVETICREEHMTIVLWSVDTRDWAHTPQNEIYKNVKKNTKNGSIILMHDFIGKNSPTPDALRRIIPMLQELGYEFVTVSQLLAGGG